jgi:hypothetical protein
MSSATSSSLSAAVAQAITFLTRPLTSAYPIQTVIKLQLALEANLTTICAPTWTPNQPAFGTASRCLALSPDCLPPKPIHSACMATGVQWFQWISQLGNQSFDLCIDPGCVAVHYKQRDGSHAQSLIVWAEQDNGYPQYRRNTPSPLQYKSHKTPAQQLLEQSYDDDEQIFSMIAEEMSAPSWMTPVEGHFPDYDREPSPLSSISAHSRCSSRSSSSGSSSGFSYITDASSSPGSISSAYNDPCKSLRRDRNRQSRVYIDTSKTEVTPYDGGKTTVLTGGVMLGDLQRGAAKSTPRRK